MAENSRGCCASARAKLEPAFTSARSAATRWCWRSSSASSASAARARSSGRPEATKAASWRVHTANEVALNTARVSSSSLQLGACPAVAPGLAPSSSTASGTSAWARSRLRAARAVSASMVPLRGWPWASRASNETAGMQTVRGAWVDGWRGPGATLRAADGSGWAGRYGLARWPNAPSVVQSLGGDTERAQAQLRVVHVADEHELVRLGRFGQGVQAAAHGGRATHHASGEEVGNGGTLLWLQPCQVI